MQHDSLIIKKEDYDIETRFGCLRAYEQTTKQIHIALTKGTWNLERCRFDKNPLFTSE
jgi:3,4-dihydroxy 2-butanone 4-phosphate synthase/GTP cyclohydrolase II